MTDKKQNYTDAQAAQMVERYEAAQTDEQRAVVVDELAHEFAKGVRSIRAKLVREGVYVKKAYKTKTGDKAETKENIVTDIASTLGVADDQLGGLEKATKKALTLIRGTLLAAAAALDAQE